jgi:hypothetical protein
MTPSPHHPITKMFLLCVTCFFCVCPEPVLANQPCCHTKRKERFYVAVWEPTCISSHWNHMVGYASALYCRFAGSGSLWVRTSLNADRNKRYENNLFSSSNRKLIESIFNLNSCDSFLCYLRMGCAPGSGRESSPRSQRQQSPVRNRHSFLDFSYVCPEPVLVKMMIFGSIKWQSLTSSG